MVKRKSKHNVLEENINYILGVKGAHLRDYKGRFMRDPIDHFNNVVLGKELKKKLMGKK